MSRRIELRHVNVVLFAAIGLLVTLYGRELRWAAAELPGYLSGEFSDTPERLLYLEAATILREGDDIDRALPLLLRSLDIDPRGEAGFWLGRYHEQKGNDAAALAAYTRYLDTDAVIVQTYLQIAAIQRRRGQLDEARRILEQGLHYFETRAERFRPFIDRSASPDHNDKARRTYAHYRGASATLREALTGLQAEPSP